MRHKGPRASLLTTMPSDAPLRQSAERSPVPAARSRSPLPVVTAPAAGSARPQVALPGLRPAIQLVFSAKLPHPPARPPQQRPANSSALLSGVNQNQTMHAPNGGTGKEGRLNLALFGNCLVRTDTQGDGLPAHCDAKAGEYALVPYSTLHRYYYCPKLPQLCLLTVCHLCTA